MSDKPNPADSPTDAQLTAGNAMQSRRDLLKKAAYATPTLFVLGTLTAADDATAQPPLCGGFPCGPS